MRKLLKDVVLVLVLVAATLAACEWLFRTALFKGWKAVAHLRQPGLYALNYPDTTGPIFSQEYWSLYTLFGGQHQPPPHPQPLLGWSGYFDRETLVHDDEPRRKGRRPVLLFGDSFSACVNVDCFQDILTVDSVFSQDHFLLNYGVGGYGLDQIHLLYKEVVGRFEKPFVVLGVMTRDMERAMLQARIGQKPWFTLEDDSLVMHGVPIDPDGRAWYERNKPAIPSYLYRLLSHQLNGDSLHGPEATAMFKEEMRRLNRALLVNTVRDIQQRGLDFVVLVFEPMYLLEGDWRSLFFRELLDSLDVPHIVTSDIARADGWKWDYTPYEQPDNGHPTLHMNRLISAVVKQFVMDGFTTAVWREENERMLAFHRAAQHRTTPEYWLEQIRRSQHWYERIVAEANELALPLDTLVLRHARYMAQEERAKGQ